MQITAAMVKELRERTGAGMMECKKALAASDGDMDAAVEAMRKAGTAKADKRAAPVARRADPDHTLGGDARRALVSLGGTCFAHRLDGRVHVAVARRQRLLAFHHAGPGALAEFLDHGCGNLHSLTSVVAIAALHGAVLALPISYGPTLYDPGTTMGPLRSVSFRRRRACRLVCFRFGGILRPADRGTSIQ